MKKPILFVLITLATLSSFANVNSGSRKIYKRLKNEDNMTNISLSKPLLKLAYWFIPKDDRKDMKLLLRSVNKVRVLAYGQDSATAIKGKSSEYYDKASKWLNENHFDDLVFVNSKGQNVNIKIRQKGDKVKELLILVNDETDFVYVNLQGRLDMSKLGEYLKDLNLDDLNFTSAMK